MPVSLARKDSFKKGIKSDDARRQRESKTISIRKNKRAEQQMKRRRNANKNASKSADAGAGKGTAAVSALPTVADLPALYAQMTSTSPAATVASAASNGLSPRCLAVQQVRKMLSQEQSPPAREVIEANMIPVLVSLLGCVEDTKLQFEAAWALTNVASTEHTQVLVQSNAIEPLSKLLMSGDADVREQCLWCLGNIAGDRPEFRDAVLRSEGALRGILLNITNPHNESMIRNAVWSLSNLCRGKPQPRLDLLGDSINVLGQVIKFNDVETLTDALWALSYVSDGEDKRIEEVLKTGCAVRLLQCLTHTDARVVTPALRTVGNIVSGNDELTGQLVQANVVCALSKLLKHGKSSIRKETCWALSNITAGSIPQIETVCMDAELLKTICEVAREDSFDVRKEAIWIISNVLSGGNADQARRCIEAGAIGSIVALMDAADVKCINLALDAVEALLRPKINQPGCNYDVLFDEEEGVEKLEKLQEHDNDKIYERVLALIEKYFQADESEEDDENVAPTADGEMFSFGSGKTLDFNTGTPIKTGGAGATSMLSPLMDSTNAGGFGSANFSFAAAY